VVTAQPNQKATQQQKHKETYSSNTNHQQYCNGILALYRDGTKYET
jgi:hypothetical protein